MTKKKQQTQQQAGAAPTKKQTQQKKQQTTSAPVAVATSFQNLVPAVRRTKDGVVINHVEFVDILTPASATAGTFALIPRINPGTATATTPNDVFQWALQPGNFTLFPWLFNQARDYEYYRWRKLRVHYVARAPTSSPGSLYMAVDPDALDIRPSGPQVMMQYAGAADTAVWKDVTLDLDCSELMSPGPFKFIVLSGGAPADRTTSAGNLYLASDASNANGAIGKMYIEYEVELKAQQTNPNGTLAAPFAAAFLTGAANAGNTYLAGAVFPTGANSLGAFLIDSATFSVPIPGSYVVTVKIAGTGLSTDAPGFALVNASIGGTGSAYQIDNSSTLGAGTAKWVRYFVNVTDIKNAINMTFTAATVTDVALNIMPCSAAMTTAWGAFSAW